MKNPKLKFNKKSKVTELRKFKKHLTEIITDATLDIVPYIVTDVLNCLKKRGILINAKSKKKNKSKKEKKSKN